MNSLYQTLSRINKIQANLASLNSKSTFNSKVSSTTDEAISSQNASNRANSTGSANSIDPANFLGGLNSNLNAAFLSQLQNDINNLAASSATSTQNSSVSPYDSIINTAANKYNLPESLIKSVIAVESNFNRQAVSPKGAMGLMQLMPATANQYNVKEPYSPEENILAGTAHLRKLLDRNDNNLIRALAAYNAGEGALSKEAVPNYQETQSYIKRVLDNYMKNNGVKL